jgi:G3E family GTPase
MMITSALASQVLPVSILAGTSSRTLIKDIVASDPKCRFGLLSSAHSEGESGSEAQPATENLVVEELVETEHHDGYDLAQVSAQVAAFAEKAQVDHLLIECNSRTHPVAFASLFVPEGNDAKVSPEVARLSSIVLSVDSEALIGSLVHGSHVLSVPSPCFLADQIEVASVMVLNGNQATADFPLARAIGAAINPRAQIVSRSTGIRPEKFLDGAVPFDFAAASDGAGWRKVIEEEPDEQNIAGKVTTFAYRARLPFHPERFWNLMQRRFPGVFRAKGFFWLATRMNVVGGLNLAGFECHCTPVGEWWAALAHRDSSGHLEIPDRFMKVWKEPFGDRRQAIAFMGIDLDPTALRVHLDACLLNEAEMSEGENSWRTLPDPFPAWASHKHEHECDDHDCCHHH